MDTREKLIDARIGMLALADELKNISRACQIAGISRTHFYDIKTAFEKYGRDGLAPPHAERDTGRVSDPDPRDDGGIPHLQLRAACAATPIDRRAGECIASAGGVAARRVAEALRSLTLAGTSCRRARWPADGDGTEVVGQTRPRRARSGPAHRRARARLSWLSGYVLRRNPQGDWPHLCAERLSTRIVRSGLPSCI